MLNINTKKLSFVAAMLFVTMASFGQLVYCSQTGTLVTNDGITNVTFHTINSNSAKTSGYVNYSGAISTIVQPSSTYSLSVSLSAGLDTTVYCTVWIDWNGNGSFADAGEQYNLGTAVSTSNGISTLSPMSITVPAGAVLGKTTMRVAAQSGAYPTVCQTGFDGEVLDYGVVISHCADGFITSVSPATPVICIGSAANLTAAAGGVSYAWSTGQTTAAVSVNPTVNSNYTVTATDSTGCSVTASASVTVLSLPTISINPASVATCAGVGVLLNTTGTATTYTWSNGATSSAIVASPAITTIYTVVGGGNGCTSSASATVTVNSGPTIGINTGVGHVCNGGADTIAASGGVSYLWSTGATTASIINHPTATTGYSVTVTGSNGCVATASTSIPVYGTVTINPSATTTCPGSAVSLTANGGTTFAWSTGQTTQIISVAPSATTVYKVTATNTYGCTGVDSAASTVTVNPNAVVTVTTNPASGVSCSGAAVTLAASGATTYNWSTGATTVSVSITPANTTAYTVTGTLNGCTGTGTTTITVYGHAVITQNYSTVCAGSAVTLNATMGTGSHYIWSTGDTTASVVKNPTATTTYAVSVTPPSTTGCLTSSATATVNVNALPPAAISSTSAAICVGSFDALTATGGGTYAWNNGSSAGSIAISPTVTTTYIVTVTSNAGCTASTSAVVTVNSLPVIPGTTGASRCGAGSVTLTATGAGTNEGYRWYTAVTGGTLVQNGGATYTTPSLSANATYYVSKYNTVTGCEGGRWYVTAIIFSGVPATPTATAATSVTCTGFTANWGAGSTSSVLDYRVDVATDAGFSNILSSWNNVNVGFTASAAVSALTSGVTYYYRVRAENACGVSASSNTISVTTISSATPVSAAATNVGCSLFTANWGAAAGATSYLIDVSTSSSFASFVAGYNDLNVGNAGSISIAGLTTGTTYYYRVRSTNGCNISGNSLEQSVTTTSSGACYCSQYGTSSATSAITNVTFNTLNFTNLTRSAGYVDYSGSLSTTVAPGTTYNLSVSVNTGGVNTVYAKVWIDWNENGVFDSTEQSLLGSATSVTNGITNLSPLSVTVPAGAVTGNAIMRVEVRNGVYGSPCDTGIVGQVEDYRVVVSNCTTPSISVTPASTTICSGQTATLNVSGTVGSAYAWSTGATTVGIGVSPTSTTTYVVTGTLAGGCSATASAVVTVSSGGAPNLTVNTPAILTCLVTVDSLKASSTTNGATFNWGGGNTYLDVVTTGGTYTVTATNPANGCTTSLATTVNQNISLPAQTLSPTLASLCPGQSATFTAGGGVSYAWTTGATTAAITVSPGISTNYAVTVTGSNGCYAVAVAAVTVNPTPIVTISPATDTICSGHSTVLTAGGGGTYLWNTGATSAAITVSVTSTIYFGVTVTSSAGCSASLARGVIVSTPSAAISPASDTICRGHSTVLTASGGGTYAWSDTATTASITVTPLVSTSYTVTVTSSGGCTATASRGVVVNAGPTLLITPLSPSTCAGQNVTLTASGGGTYSWSNSSTSAAITVNPVTNTTYSLTVTNYGCSASGSVLVTVTPLPATPVAGNNSPVSLGHAIDLTASTVAGAAYQWTGPNGFTSTLQNPVISSATTANSGAYSVVVTVNGCTSLPATTTVVVNAFTLFMDTVSANPSAQVAVLVRVLNFNMMLSAQATIHFDTSKLQFVQTQQYGVSSLSSGSFGTNLAADGNITFTWSDPNLTGVTLSNDTTFFALLFNVHGPSGTATPVIFTNTPPTTFEFVDTSFNPISYILNPGEVIINGNDTISGKIETELGYGVQLTTVTATGSPVYTDLTDTSGTYWFNLFPGSSYTVTPSKNNDSTVTNGITTLDYLLIQRDILGTALLSTPYKLIAADVNGSGTVTSLDLLYIRSLILGNITSFPGGKLWAFVPQSYVFPNPLNPFPFPSSLTFASVTQQTSQNFIGIKLGDVNDSWNPTVKSVQSGNTVTLTAPEMTVLPGGEISVPIRAGNFKQISGMQFTMEWDPSLLKFSSVDSTGGALTVNYGESKTGSGLLSIQWTDPDYGATTIADDSVLFYVAFKVTGQAGETSPMSIVSRIASIEVVDNDLNVLNCNVNNGAIRIASTTAVNSISGIKDPGVAVMPNPFTEHTQLSFELYNAGDVKIEVYNELGQLVTNYDGNYGVGKHQIEIGNNWSSGLYFVRFTTGDYITTLRIANTAK